MPSDISSDPSNEEKALRARLPYPIPLQVRRELNVCFSTKAFEASLGELHAAMAAALSRPGTISRHASASAVQTCWKDSMAELEVALGNTDRLAQALIGSIKAMLVFD